MKINFAQNKIQILAHAFNQKVMRSFKQNLKQLLFLGLIFSASISQAQRKATLGTSYSMPAVEVGFKWNTVNITNATSAKQEVGFQLGFSTVFNMMESFGIRSGLFYSERPFKSEFAGGSTVKGKITYFEVPAHLMFKFEDYAGVYVGPTMAIKMGDELVPGSLTDVKSMVVPITFGAQFKLTPDFGANVFFETVPGDLATDVSSSRAVGMNLLITFD